MASADHSIGAQRDLKSGNDQSETPVQGLSSLIKGLGGSKSPAQRPRFAIRTVNSLEEANLQSPIDSLQPDDASEKHTTSRKRTKLTET